MRRNLFSSEVLNCFNVAILRLKPEVMLSNFINTLKCINSKHWPNKLRNNALKRFYQIWEVSRTQFEFCVYINHTSLKNHGKNIWTEEYILKLFLNDKITTKYYHGKSLILFIMILIVIMGFNCRTWLEKKWRTPRINNILKKI